MLLKVSTRVMSQTATIPKWMWRMVRATGRRTKRKKQRQRKRNVKNPFRGLHKVFSPGAPSVILRFSNPFTVVSRFMHRDMARYKDHLRQMQGNVGLAAPSGDKFSSYPLLPLLHVRLRVGDSP